MIILQIARKQNQKYATVKNTPNILQIIKGKKRKLKGKPRFDIVKILLASRSDIALIRQQGSAPNQRR